MDTNTTSPETLSELTLEEKYLIAAIRSGDHHTASRLIAKIAPPDWTYEQRAALHVLAYLALAGALDAGLMRSPHSNAFEHLIEGMGAALIDALHTLGCPHDLTLAQILDRASSFDPDGGAS